VIGMGLAFLLFLPTSGTTDKSVPALLVVGIMAVFAVSELLLSPIGLSVTTKLAPEAFRTQMMALYFFSVGIGNSMSKGAGALLRSGSRIRLLRDIGAVAIGAGVIVFAIAPWISRLMEGVH
jgi:POT family proton-dependent oligopeptide transporter